MNKLTQSGEVMAYAEPDKMRNPLKIKGLQRKKEVHMHFLDWWSVGGSNCIRHFQSLKTVENQGGQTRCPKV